MPDDLQQAHALFHDKKYAEAVPLYQALLHVNLNDFLVWANLGISLRYMGYYDSAVLCLQRADELRPNIPGLLRHYAYCLMCLNKKDQSLQAFAAAEKLAPHDFNVRSFYAAALREFGRDAEAIAQYDAAHAIEPDNDEILWQRINARLRQGKFRESWKDFEIRWKLSDPQFFLQVEKEKAFVSKRWRGEDLKGKSIHIYGEQGFGDTILCSRYVPLVKALGAHVILRGTPELRRLFQTIPGVDSLVEGINPKENVDFHIPIMSLPGLFDTDVSTIPPPAKLNTSETLPAEAARLLALGGNNFKVGIVWSGRPTFAGNYKRAVAFKRFLALAEISGVQLYSLQKGAAAQELVDCGAQGLVLELGAHLQDFADTAAALKRLDLVIMTDSAVAHVAGSIDCPVWNLLTTDAYWVYLNDREDSPWYQSMRLFRQPEPGDWDSVFIKVEAELKKAVAQKNIN